MKTMSFAVALTLAASFSLILPADACGPSNSGRSYYSTGNGPYPYGPYGPSPYPYGSAVSPAAVPVTTSSAPSAHLTVLPTTSLADSTTPTTPSPSATIHVISDSETTKPTAKVDPTKTVNAGTATKATTSPLPEGFKALAGTWMAVGRYGDNELSTIELQLDKSGWAKLTVPGTDGKPSTVTRHVDFEGQEMNLTGSDGALALGKVVEFNDRQLVLDRADGQVTFVRP